MRHIASSCLIRTAVLLIASGTAVAQIAGSGTIQGTITDPSGAVIPQASVTAINTATGVPTARLTTSAGLYVLSPLPPGEYNVRVSAPGFQTLTQEHIIVEATATVALDLQLKVGSAGEQVTVEALAPTLRTEDATLGGSMQNNIYDSLPLAMGSGVPRDPTQFIALSPGVAAVVTQSAGPSYTSFNGAQQENNELYLEGIAMTFPNQQGDTRDLALGVSVEAVEQFQVEVNGEKAQYQGQGFHNYVLKSGTNQFHGSAYEYFRNTALDARGFFSPFIPLDHQNEFGANLGGPLKKDRVFFFGNYSGYYYNTSTAPVYISVPTTAERQGDFSALPTSIYDPNTTVCMSAVCSKQPFPGNLIPASRLSSVSKSFQSYLPAPTNSNLVNNYLSTLPRSVHNNNTTEKVDVNISEKNRWYGVLSRAKWQTDYTGNLTPTGTSLPLPYTSTPGIVVEVPTIAQIHQTYVFTPTLLNSVSVGLTRIWIPIFSVTADGKYPEKAGLTGLPPYGQAADGFPGISFSGTNVPSSWAGTGPFNEAENNYTFQDSLLWVHGKHSITSGFQLQRLEDNNARPTSGTSASFTFANNETAGFSPTGTLLTTTGNGYASYLLGAVNAATITLNNVVWNGARYHDYSVFIQDDWSALPHLTLNLGVRYDIFGPSTEAFNRMSFLNPRMPNPAVGGYLGALEYAGHGPNTCECAVPIRTHYLNFAPRIGVAYSLNNKTVLRAGFILAFAHGAAGIGGNGSAAGTGLTGYNPPASYTSPATGLPSFYWDQGVPRLQQPPLMVPGFGAGFTTSNPTGAVSVAYINPDLAGKAPYYINWSFGLQRELPAALTFGASYSASVGHFLARNGDVGIWSNSMPVPYLALGSLLNVQATPANIAAAQATFPGIALPFSNFQGTIAQMLKPFPQYSGVSYYSGDLGNSTYNSVQLTLNRRFSQGLTAQLGYTFSKELDNIPNGGQLGTSGGTRNPFNGRLDKAPGAIDHPHIFHGTFVYNLPLGKGHSLGSANLLVRSLVSGWTISGLVTFTSGAPLGITGSGCSVPGIVSTCIVSYNPSFNGPVRINGSYGSGNALAPGAVSYLSKAAFMDPAPYAFGNAARAAPFGLLAPFLLDEDITVRREIPVRERVRVIISADMFNITNSVYFAAPGSNIDSANFGQVQTSANAPRKFQFNARIAF